MSDISRDQRTVLRRDNARPLLLAMVLLAGPYYLNDFANIYIHDWRLWLFIDYAIMKGLPLIVILWLLRRGLVPASAFHILPSSTGNFLLTFLLTTLIGTVIDQNGYTLIADWPTYPRLGGMPEITSPLWNWIDLTFGLLAVGVVEELIFRGYLRFYLERHLSRPAAVIAASAVLFGLIHWSQGGHAVLITGLIGAVFMSAFFVSRALLPVILAHFVINFIDFSGLIPKEIFQFAATCLYPPPFC